MTDKIGELISIQRKNTRLVTGLSGQLFGLQATVTQSQMSFMSTLEEHKKALKEIAYKMFESEKIEEERKVREEMMKMIDETFEKKVQDLTMVQNSLTDQMYRIQASIQQLKAQENRIDDLTAELHRNNSNQESQLRQYSGAIQSLWMHVEHQNAATVAANKNFVTQTDLCKVKNEMELMKRNHQVVYEKLKKEMENQGVQMNSLAQNVYQFMDKFQQVDNGTILVQTQQAPGNVVMAQLMVNSDGTPTSPPPMLTPQQVNNPQFWFHTVQDQNVNQNINQNN